MIDPCSFLSPSAGGVETASLCSALAFGELAVLQGFGLEKKCYVAGKIDAPSEVLLMIALPSGSNFVTVSNLCSGTSGKTIEGENYLGIANYQHLVPSCFVTSSRATASILAAISVGNEPPRGFVISYRSSPSSNLETATKRHAI